MELESDVRAFVYANYSAQLEIIQSQPLQINPVLNAWRDIARYSFSYGVDIGATSAGHTEAREFYAVSLCIERWARHHGIDPQNRLANLAQKCMDFLDPSPYRGIIPPRPTVDQIALEFDSVMPLFHEICNHVAYVATARKQGTAIDTAAQDTPPKSPPAANMPIPPALTDKATRIMDMIRRYQAESLPPCKYSDFVDNLQMSRTTVYDGINELKSRGLIQSMRGGGYRLADSSTESVPE